MRLHFLASLPQPEQAISFSFLLILFRYRLRGPAEGVAALENIPGTARPCHGSGDQSPTSKTRLQSRLSPFEICYEQSDNLTDLPPSTSNLASRKNFTNAPYSSPPQYCSYHKEKWARPGNLQTKQCSQRYYGSIGQRCTFTFENGFCNSQQQIVGGFHPFIGHKGPQGEQRYSSTLFLTSALEGGEGSASRPGRSLPPGKTRYPLYRRLGGLQGRSGQVRKISIQPGFDPRTVQHVGSRYTDYATRPRAADCALVKLGIHAHKIENKVKMYHSERTSDYVNCTHQFRRGFKSGFL